MGLRIAKYAERVYLETHLYVDMTIQQKLFEQYAYTLESMADEPEPEDSVVRKLLLKSCAHGMREAAKGYARYEMLRCCDRHTMADLQARNLNGENFDSMIDAIIANKRRDIDE
jgi:hypothetical protein